MRVARSVPARIDKLVMVDPPVSGPGRRCYPIPLAPLLDLVAYAKMGQVEEYLRSGRGSTWPRRTYPHACRMASTCDERAIEETYRGFHEDDFHGDVADLKVRRRRCSLLAGVGSSFLKTSKRCSAFSRPFWSSVSRQLGIRCRVEEPEAFLRELLSLVDCDTQNSA